MEELGESISVCITYAQNRRRGLGKNAVLVAATIILLLAGTLVERSLIAQSQDIGLGQGEAQGRAMSLGKALPKPSSVESQKRNPRQISLSAKDSSIHFVLNEIARQAGLRVIYDDREKLSGHKVTVAVKNLSPEGAFQEALKGTNLQARIISDSETVVIGFPAKDAVTANRTISKSQQDVGTLTGRISDSSTGEGVAGVTVSVNGTTLRALTADNGSFAIKDIPIGEHAITIRAFGYRSLSRKVTVTSGTQVKLQIVLSPTPTSLSGVVTTGMGERRRMEVGNDITKVNVDSIVRTMPVNSLADLLATRVPGLTAIPSSGRPGAPTRIRIRGVSSINSSNDPIVIIDGVQVYARQVESPLGALGEVAAADKGAISKAAQLSPLDQIDLNSIEHLEVLKGPSAVAMYGSDAANGVIVITTKRGQPGASQWSIRGSRSYEFIPGKWNDNYYAWGHSIFNERIPISCVGKAVGINCEIDSIVSYQILNDKATTPFGRGNTDMMSTTVSGSQSRVNYSLTGTIGRTLGLLKLPKADEILVREMRLTLPGHVKRPQSTSTESFTVTVGMEVGQARFTYTSQTGKGITSNSPFQSAISKSRELPPPAPLFDTDGNELTAGTGLLTQIPDYRRQTTSKSLNSTQSLGLHHSTSHGISMNASVGLNTMSYNDRSWLGRGECAIAIASCDNTGSASVGVTGRETLSGSITSNYTYRMGFNLRTRLTGGVNYKREKYSSLTGSASGLPLGATASVRAEHMLHGSQSRDQITAGGYIGIELHVGDKFFLPLEFRRDAGSMFGTRSKPTFPRISLSHVLSNESLFSAIPFSDAISLLRLRFAYGRAGNQPGFYGNLRTYAASQDVIDGVSSNIVEVGVMGNPFLAPERVTEVEGGFDLEVFDNKVDLTVTGYRKFTRDMIVSEALPPSVIGEKSIYQNLGDVSNTGMDFTLGIKVLQMRNIMFNTSMNLSFHRNEVKSLQGTYESYAGFRFGVEQNEVSTRNIVGYPLNSRWAPPIVSFADVNGDGYIEQLEVRFSDSALYLGAPYEKYSLNIHPSLTLFRSLTISPVVSYKNGLNQTNTTGRGKYSRAVNDPATPLADRAYLEHSLLSSAQTVSVLRFEQLAINYILPQSVSRKIRIKRSITLGLSGNNLGIHTNYRGKDPYGGFSGESMTDNGFIPTPRRVGISINVN